MPLVNSLLDKMIMVNSFNEWHEDTQIEPVLEAGSSDYNDGHSDSDAAFSTFAEKLKEVLAGGGNSEGYTTTYPELLTGGLEYVGYGNLYLDILGAATTNRKDNMNIFDSYFNSGINAIDETPVQVSRNGKP